MRAFTLAFSAAVFAFTTSSAVSETVTLRFGAPAPVRAHLNVQVFGPWAEKVSKDSQGTLKIEFIPGGVLGTEGQLLERVSSGVVDIAYDLQSYYPGRFPKSEVVTLPFLFEKSEHASLALWNLLSKGMIASEYKGIKPLGVYVFPNAVFMSTAPIRKIEEFKGKKIQASTKLRTNEALALGAIPVSVPIFDLYQALGRGTVSIAMQQWTAVQPFRLHEVGSLA